jgi:hypothetical protein
MRYAIIYAICTAIAAVPVVPQPAHQTCTNVVKHLLINLDSKIDDDRASAYEEILAVQEMIEKGMLERLRQIKDGGSVESALAASIITDRYSRHTIEWLVANIELKVEFGGASRFSSTPCARILGEIGQSAGPIIIEHCKVTRKPISDEAVGLFAEVLLAVYDQNKRGPSVALMVLECEAQRFDKVPTELALLIREVKMRRDERVGSM